MGRHYALLLAAAFVGVGASAQAADLLPPPPPIEAPPPPPDFGGWYLRGDVGVGATQMSDWRYTLAPDIATGVLPAGPVWNTHRSLADTAFAGGGFGYQFNSWLRGDLTGEYRIDSAYHATNHFSFVAGGVPFYGFDQYSANLGTAVFLANGYVDLGTWYGVTPFVGGGVGAAFHSLKGLTDVGHGIANGGYGLASDANQTNFAWAVMAGLAMNVTPNLKMELGYRYLDMGRVHSNPITCNATPCFQERHSFDLASHDVRLGFRYMLGGFGGGSVLAAGPGFGPPPAPAYAPPPPRQPLVRKY